MCRASGHEGFIRACEALWTKFDINALTKGAEDFDKQVRRMPKEQKELGELPTYQKLEEVVTSFKAFDACQMP